MAAQAGRQPLLVVRSERALPGRSPYVEVTRARLHASQDSRSDGARPRPPTGLTRRARLGDEYRNTSVVLPGRPLSSAASSSSEGSSEESSPGGRGARHPPPSPPPPIANGTPAATVDSIGNCNVVNEVGQSRRLEKQRARRLPPGGETGDCSPPPCMLPKDEAYYSQFPVMKEPPRRRDIVAFKCWDMDEQYSPYISGYQEATVMEVSDGGQLTLQLLDYQPRGRRQGRFEITSADDDEIVDLEEEAGIVEKAWSELFQPRLLHP
ncbi:uncharacterized protein LOC119095018 [Pollicipes pollicipes]|uniref:uncharacterized protein LOC119095018 n=1 Tax=Pollicipes pollicipes TaxID=41117 RepID=UPI00188575E3|nr:uncharacterized protein LOC119095018 [Pollicipes pollicipes]